MRDWAKEKERRVAFIKKMLATSGAKGIVFGNSGGKDSALVAALCSFATDNVLGVSQPLPTVCVVLVARHSAAMLTRKWSWPLQHP